jgi:hypothetical protein
MPKKVTTKDVMKSSNTVDVTKTPSYMISKSQNLYSKLKSSIKRPDVPLAATPEPQKIRFNNP